MNEYSELSVNFIFHTNKNFDINVTKMTIYCQYKSSMKIFPCCRITPTRTLTKLECINFLCVCICVHVYMFARMFYATLLRYTFTKNFLVKLWALVWLKTVFSLIWAYVSNGSCFALLKNLLKKFPFLCLYPFYNIYKHKQIYKVILILTRWKVSEWSFTEFQNEISNNNNK